MNVRSEPVSEESARLKAEWWYSAMSAGGGKGDPVLSLRLDKDQWGQAYVFSYSPSGFVIVAGEETYPEIIGYSFTDAPGSSTRFVDSTVQVQSTNIHSLAKRKAQSVIEPLIHAKWDQQPPYNNSCPLDGTMRTIVGCVPVAVGQVLQYYQWPPQGVGTVSMDWKGSVSNQTLTVDLTAQRYDWSTMPDSLAGATQEQIKAVSDLLFHIGVSMKTDFSISGSGTQIWDYNPVSLGQYFALSSTGAQRSNFTGFDTMLIIGEPEPVIRDLAGEWDSLLVKELRAGRPVIYSARPDTGSGHMFIIDGIDAMGMYHVNWGWGGRYNGYFSIDALIPGSFNFRKAEKCFIYLAPSTVARTPKKVEALLWNGMVEIRWNAPDITLDMSHYQVYRNDTLIADNVTTLVIFDTINVVATTTKYSVSAVDEKGTETRKISASGDLAAVVLRAPAQTVPIGNWNTWPAGPWRNRTSYWESGNLFEDLEITRAEQSLYLPTVQLPSDTGSALVHNLTLSTKLSDGSAADDTVYCEVMVPGSGTYQPVRAVTVPKGSTISTMSDTVSLGEFTGKTVRVRYRHVFHYRLEQQAGNYARLNKVAIIPYYAANGVAGSGKRNVPVKQFHVMSCKDGLVCTFTSNTQTRTVQIYSLQGKRLASLSSQGAKTLHVRLPQGMYIVREQENGQNINILRVSVCSRDGHVGPSLP